MGYKTYHEALDEQQEELEMMVSNVDVLKQTIQDLGLHAKSLRNNRQIYEAETIEKAIGLLQTKATQYPSAAQPWLNNIPMMQQSVLFSAIRGPDGFAKSHPVKPLLRFYRRSILMSAFDNRAIDNPYDPGGGSFTGPSLKLFPADEDIPFEHFAVIIKGMYEYMPVDKWPEAMRTIVDGFLNARDEYHLHFYGHCMHAFQIIGVHHPDPIIKQFWRRVYERMVNALHLEPEPDSELNRRLGDKEDAWVLKDEGDGYRL